MYPFIFIYFLYTIDRLCISNSFSVLEFWHISLIAYLILSSSVRTRSAYPNFHSSADYIDAQSKSFFGIIITQIVYVARAAKLPDEAAPSFQLFVFDEK